MDRRAPVARYVLVAEEDAQGRLAEAAELAYRRLVQADSWAAAGTLVLPSPQPDEPTPVKRRRLRWRSEEASATQLLTVTAAIAAAARAALEVPGQVAARAGCAAEGRLATSMSEVVLELVGDIAGEPVETQPDHPAYRQTVRLAAELRALDQVLAEVGCADDAGCVAVRGPQAWGRRAEDVEVTEVLAVLQQLARH